MKNIKRNGDWHLVPINEEMTGEMQKHKGSFVFAEGETTGHYHTITVSNVDDMVLTKLPDGSYMVNLKSEATLTHPEHSLKNDLKVPVGTYKLIQRREKDWFQLSTRKVID